MIITYLIIFLVLLVILGLLATYFLYKAQKEVDVLQTEIEYQIGLRNKYRKLWLQYFAEWDYYRQNSCIKSRVITAKEILDAHKEKVCKEE
jgi:hypothetical protein